MYMLDSSLGIIIGIVVGLTGAGGSLLSIPMFIIFFNMGLKEATLYSLVVEIVACFTSFLFQFKLSKNKIGLMLALYSLFGSLLASPFKKGLPESIILVMYLGVCFYSIYKLWIQKNIRIKFLENRSQNTLAIGVGLVLGILTTFTGLGGGVLIVPALLGFFAFSQKEAVATSLLTIGLSAFASLIAQFLVGSEIYISTRIASLSLGIILGSLLIEVIMKQIPKDKTIFMRRVVFTLVIMVSIGKMVV